MKTQVELQHGLENFAVIISARGIAAVFLGKVTHFNCCGTNTTATVSPKSLFKKNQNKANPSLLTLTLYFLLKNLLSVFL